MCGRYVLSAAVEELVKKYGAIPKGLFRAEPSYNVAPSTHMPIVTERGDDRTVSLSRWGLVPFWAKSRDTGYSMINARSETLDEKRSFSQPFATRRCIVPADGFYEWKKSSAGKIPYYITTPDRSLMNFAGLYELWKDDDGKLVNSFTIITTSANKTMEDLHDRMPAMLLPEEFDFWLDPNNSDLSALKDLLRPWPDDAMTIYRVGVEVNNARNNGARLIEPYRDLFGRTE